MNLAQAPDISASSAQLDQLTGLRGLAAWFVVLYHIRLSLAEILPAPVIAGFSKGYLAVDLFFMLSGFVMWLSYQQRFRSQGAAQIGPFLWKRFARIWPLHALILALFAAFAGVLAITGRPLEDYSFAELPLHILLIHNWGLTSEIAWNDPSWSISTEFGAYLLFPLLVLGVRWERLGIGVLVMVLGALALGLHSWFALQGHVILDADIARTGLLRCLIEFTMGIVLANIWQRQRDARHRALAPLAAMIAAAGAGIAGSLPETLFVPAMIAALLLTLALDHGLAARLLGSRALVAIGDWSYATYLSHFLLFILFKILFVGEDLQIGWAGLGGFVGIVLFSSAILYTWAEKPAQRWLNSRRPLTLRSA
ncbi:acyltransferase family protein [Qipengyuania sp. ASV99]|uniref:acyltransferase family protein n=1 Tax=Qipengyuania sp. ASV99 TaxID=3399681 RepID=UPI003A4C5EEB